MNSLALVEAASFGDLTDTAMDFLDRAVAAIKVESTWGPPIYIPSPFRKSADTAITGGSPSTTVPGKGFDVMRMLKPKVTLEMHSGWGRDRSFAPYGDPGESKWGYVALAAGLLVLFAAYGGVRYVKG